MQTTTYILEDEPVTISPGRERRTITVSNTGDRAIQVGSHFHFFEVNRALRFDRQLAFGMRLDIPSGTAVRFEPGDTRDVTLVALGGTRRSVGFNGLVNGSVTGDASRSLLRARERGFLCEEAVYDGD
jgi:urease beta subunit